jgi:hypothetical protein
MFTNISKERSTLNMQETHTSKILVTIHKSTWHHNPEDKNQCKTTVRITYLWKQNDESRMRKTETFYLQQKQKKIERDREEAFLFKARKEMAKIKRNIHDYSSHHQTACSKAMEGLHFSYHVTLSHQYSLANFATL